MKCKHPLPSKLMSAETMMWCKLGSLNQKSIRSQLWGTQHFLPANQALLFWLFTGGLRKNTFSSAKNAVACCHYQLMQQSLAALQSFLFHCSIDTWAGTWQNANSDRLSCAMFRTFPSQISYSGAWQYWVCSCWFPVRLENKSISSLFDIVCCPYWLQSSTGFHSVDEPCWSTCQHIFFTDWKFHCLSGNFETILLFPEPNSCKVWILIVSLADILSIVNHTKIQTIHYLQNKQD